MLQIIHNSRDFQLEAGCPWEAKVSLEMPLVFQVWRALLRLDCVEYRQLKKKGAGSPKGHCRE